MDCNICGSATIVKDSRKYDGTIMRRRECSRCNERFTTMEVVCNTVPYTPPRTNKASRVIKAERSPVDRRQAERRRRTNLSSRPAAASRKCGINDN